MTKNNKGFIVLRKQFLCLRFSYEQSDIIFFISPVGDLPEIEECLYLTTAIFIPKLGHGVRPPEMQTAINHK